MTGGTPSPVHAGPAARYEEAERRYVAERVPEARRSTLISRLRLLTFLPGAACLVWALSRGPAPLLLPLAAVLLGLFGVLVVWHARVEDRIAWLEALRLVNERAAARVGRDWGRLPAADAPPGVSLEAHPYAADLDLFGRASLFQWLGPAATATGGNRLASWLLTPAATERDSGAPGSIRRPGAARRMARAPRRARCPLVERAARGNRPLPRVGRGPAPAGRPPGASARGGAVDHRPQCPAPDAVRNGSHRRALWLIPVVVGLTLSFPLSQRIYRWMDRADGGQHALSRYAHVLEHAVLAPRIGRRLSEIQERLTTQGRQRARVHAAPEPDPGIRRPAPLRRRPPLPDPGPHALGLPRRLRARALAHRRGSARARLARRGRRAGRACAPGRASAATITAGVSPVITDARRHRRRLARPSAPAGRPPRRQRRAGRPAGDAAARHRLQHVRQEHAAAIGGSERRAGARRQRGRGVQVHAARRATCRRASACRIRSSSGCPTSWRRWRA